MTGGTIVKAILGYRWLLSATVAIALLAPGTAFAKDYTVAILQSLSGPTAFVGVAVKDGATLAAEELNNQQFLGAGNTLKILIGDDGADRGQVVTMMQQYAADSDVLLVMGPTAGPIAVAGMAVANDRKLPTISTTNSLAALQVGPWGFIMTSPAAVAIPSIAGYTVEKLKAKACATVHIVDNEAHVTLQKLFEDYVVARGVKIVAREGIKGTDSDFAALATKITAMDDIDCLYLGALAPQAANVVRQLRQAGLDPKVRIVGTNALASPDLLSKGGTAVEGVYFMADWAPGGNSDDGRKFVDAYKAKFSNLPENWNAMGYSVMRVIATALKNAGAQPTRESVREALTKTKDVPVVVGRGLYSMDADRIPHYGMSVLMVKDGKFVVAP